MRFHNTKTSASLLLLLGPAVTVSAFAEVYMSAEQAASIFFPKQSFKKSAAVLTDEEKKIIEQLSKLPVKSKTLNALTSPESNAVFIDQVIGKHELITYAVGISKEAKVVGVEILEYRESYGHQVRREAWRRQFIGKNKTSELELNKDIKNLSGATLSSAHITEGVRRLVYTYEQIKNRL